MTVVVTQSTNKRFQMHHSTNATLATAIGEVINSLDGHKVPMNQIKISSLYDEKNEVFIVMALQKLQ